MLKGGRRILNQLLHPKVRRLSCLGEGQAASRRTAVACRALVACSRGNSAACSDVRCLIRQTCWRSRHGGHGCPALTGPQPAANDQRGRSAHKPCSRRHCRDGLRAVNSQRLSPQVHTVLVQHYRNIFLHTLAFPCPMHAVDCVRRFADQQHRQHDQQRQQRRQQQQFVAELAELAQSLMLLDVCPQLMAVRARLACLCSRLRLKTCLSGRKAKLFCLWKTSFANTRSMSTSASPTGGSHNTAGSSAADEASAARAAPRAAVAAAGRRRRGRFLQGRSAQEAGVHAGTTPPNAALRTRRVARTCKMMPICTKCVRRGRICFQMFCGLSVVIERRAVRL